MNIITAIKSGLSRSVNVWKGILICWFITFLLTSFIIVPLRASLNAAFGNSMITEKLTNGINVDVLGDLGKNLHSTGASLFSGIILMSVIALLANVFITGGLFDSLKKDSPGFDSQNFFRTSAKNFWSFLVISAILYIIAAFVIIAVSFALVLIADNSENALEGTVLLTIIMTITVFLTAVSIIFLVADYARAWQASKNYNACFKALGFGFSQTFRKFFSSVGLMLIILVLQTIIGLAVIKLIAGYTPVKGGGVLLLFIMTQLLIIANIFLKSLRYAGVTSLMEQYAAKMTPVPEEITRQDTFIPKDIATDLKTETYV